MEQGKYSQKISRERMEHFGSSTLPLLMETVVKLFDISESSSALCMAHASNLKLIGLVENTSALCMQRVSYET